MPKPSSATRSASSGQRWKLSQRVAAGLQHTGAVLVLEGPPVVVPVAALDLVGGGRRPPEEAVGEAVRVIGHVVGSLRRSVGGQHVAAQVVDGRRAEERHRPAHVGVEQAEHVVDAPLTGRAQPVQVGPPGHHGPRAEGHRLHDVAAPPHAAVADDLDAVADRVGHRRDEVDGRGRAVELAAAVVGQRDGLDPGVGGEPRRPRPSARP